MPDQGLQDYLAQLEGQRAMLNIQIAGVRAALGLAPEEGAAATAPPVAGAAPGSDGRSRDIIVGRIRSDEFFRMSIPEAIKRFLEIMKQPQAPKAIADGLKSGGILSESKHFYANVFTALKRMRAQGAVTNTKRGWGLSDWYAGRSGFGQETKPKRGKRTKGKRNGGTKSASPYRAFVGDAMKAGKTMAEAAAAWREKNEPKTS
jgi:hypothetical protein